MKKTAIFVFGLFLMFAMSLSAQQTNVDTANQNRIPHFSRLIKRPLHHAAQHASANQMAKQMPVDSILDDLTVQQKTLLDMITRKYSKAIEAYRHDLHQLRDTISHLMNEPGDNSERLFPLYEREGALQAKISKEFYRCKMEMDAVLTPDQQRRISESFEAKRPKGPRHPKQK